MNIEQSVIGCLLLASSKTLPLCVNSGVSSAWFTDPKHKAIFDVALAEFRAGRYPDEMMVESALPDLPPRYIQSCIDDTPTAEHMGYYLDILKADYHKRKLVETLTAISENLAKQSTGEANQEAIAAIIATVNQINDDCAGTRESPSDIAARLITLWRKPPEKRGLISWGLYDIDEQLGPIAQEYICIAAQESAGKTALAIQLIDTLALTGKRGSILSLESRADQIVARQISHLGQVNTLDMRRGKGRESEFTKAEQVAEQLKTLPVSISDKPSNTDQILSWALNEKAMGSCLLIVDNMKHIQPARKYGNLPEMFRDFSLQLKWIRDRTGLPLIVLHHLSKEDDVSWSRDLRRDVDILIFLKPDEKRSSPPCHENDWIGQWYVNVEVVKCRDGQSGFQIPLEFRKYVQTFVGEKVKPTQRWR